MTRDLTPGFLITINELDLWAVWPCGTECSLREPRDFQELLTWKSDDYEVKLAIGYDGTSSPIFATKFHVQSDDDAQMLMKQDINEIKLTVTWE